MYWGGQIVNLIKKFKIVVGKFRENYVDELMTSKVSKRPYQRVSNNGRIIGHAFNNILEPSFINAGFETC